jgi:hypothetical protein
MLGALLGASTSPSDAAVRLCRGTISSGPVIAATEREAKRQALDIWKGEAAKLGVSFSAWGRAADKILACKPAVGGKFVCLARAAPCTIEQAPNRRENRSKRIEI